MANGNLTPEELKRVDEAVAKASAEWTRNRPQQMLYGPGNVTPFDANAVRQAEIDKIMKAKESAAKEDQARLAFDDPKIAEQRGEAREQQAVREKQASEFEAQQQQARS